MELQYTSRLAQLVELEKKPMARAFRPSLFQRDIKYRLSSAAVELLFERAHVLSEGQIDRGRYYGSTMISLDLGRLEDAIADALTAETAVRFGELADRDPLLEARAQALGRAEARRLAGAIRDPQIDVGVRSRGAHLYIDLDIEAELGER
jgi:hypothetical protein